MKTPLPSQENLLARLDRIPLIKPIVRLLILLACVWLAEAFDIGIVGPVMAVLKSAWHLSVADQAWLGISSTLGVVLGMTPAGMLADRIGRRRVVIVGILVFSVITVLGSLAQSLSQLLIIRFLAGLGEGAVLPLPYLYLAEFVHTKRRAVSVGIANGVLTAAYLLPNLVGSYAIHTYASSMAWRLPFLLGAIPLFLVAPLYLWLPESPRYLIKKGRILEVDSLVTRLEDAARLPHDTSLVNPRAAAALRLERAEETRLIHVLRRPFLTRGLITTGQLTGALILFYILLVYGPTLLVTRGFGTGTAVLLTGIMMAIAGIGSIIQGLLSDRFGRKAILSIYFSLAAVGCVLFAASVNWWITALAAFLSSFFGLGVFPVSKLLVAEQFPTHLRGMGVYLSEMSARSVSGIITLAFLPFALAQFGSSVIFIAIAVILIAFMIPVWLAGRETARISVEEAGATSLAALAREMEGNRMKVQPMP